MEDSKDKRLGTQEDCNLWYSHKMVRYEIVKLMKNREIGIAKVTEDNDTKMQRAHSIYTVDYLEHMMEFHRMSNKASNIYYSVALV